jgi:hypothetical protein
MDRGIAARTEQALATVVPADTITLVWQLAHHLENLDHALRFTHAMACDHDEVASFGCVCGSVHDILLRLATSRMQLGYTAAIGATTDSRRGKPNCARMPIAPDAA